jgi:hypothetical protein
MDSLGVDGRVSVAEGAAVDTAASYYRLRKTESPRKHDSELL